MSQILKVLLALFAASSLWAADWLQFRGPNGSGVADSAEPPTEFGPQEVVWRASLPSGHSSPVLAGDRIFLTGTDGDELLTICLRRRDGRVLWRRAAPRDRVSELNRLNHPASPSPASDGANVYVFFGDYGLLSYDREGNERWRLPLGPFDNWMGMASSPIVADDKVILVCDQDRDSFMIAVDRNTGSVEWKTERPEYTRGFATPTLHRPPSGPPELVVPGAYQVAGYSLSSGQLLWWARGLAFEVKSLAVTDGATLFVHGWSSTGDRPNDPLPPFNEAIARHDSDGDGRFSKQEAFFPMMQARFGSYFDFDRDGFVGAADWSNTQARLAARNALLAIRLGGRGDLTETGVLWRFRRTLPNVPSPLLYKGVLYLIKDGGILTALSPESGEVLKQARLPGALGRYWASPVAASGRVYVASEAGVLSVLQAGAEWTVVSQNDLGEEVFATPAIGPQRLYVRTRESLYCFGEGNAAR